MTAALAFACRPASLRQHRAGREEGRAEATRPTQGRTADAKEKADEATADAKAEAQGGQRCEACGKPPAPRSTREGNHRREDGADGRSTVDASDINVDTFHETKTVVLKGTVPTAAQKVDSGQHCQSAKREATRSTTSSW